MGLRTIISDTLSKYPILISTGVAASTYVVGDQVIPEHTTEQMRQILDYGLIGVSPLAGWMTSWYLRGLKISKKRNIAIPSSKSSISQDLMDLSKSAIDPNKKFLSQLSTFGANHTILSGAIAATTYLGAQYALQNEHFMHQLSSNPTKIATLGLFAWFAASLSIHALKQSKNYFESGSASETKNVLLYKIGQQDRAIANAEKEFERTQSDRTKSYLSELYTESGRHQDATKIAKGFSNHPTPLGDNTGTLGKLQALFILEKQLRKVPTFQSFFLYASVLNRWNNQEPAKVLIEEAIERGIPNDLQGRVEKLILAGHFGESQGWDSKNYWERSIKLLQDHPEIIKFDQIDDYDVFHFSGERLISNELIFKRGLEEALLSEEHLTKELQEKLEETRFKCVDPIGIFEVDGFHYLILKHAKGERLAEYLERTGDLNVLGHAVENLAYINAKMQHYSDHKNELTYNKIKNRLNQLEPEIAQTVWDNLQFVFRNQENFPLVFNKDGHSDNYFFTEQGELQTLDVQDKGIVPIDEEASRLYALGESFDRVLPSYHWITESIYQHYAKTYFENQHQTHSIPDFDQQVKKMILGTSFSHFLYHQNHPHKLQRGKESLKNALFIMDGLQDQDSLKLNTDELKSIDALRPIYLRLAA